jgi:hypothetical protein
VTATINGASMTDRTYDLTIVAGRRPTLLRDTLESFGQLVFPQFTFQSVLVNLDPFAGDEAAAAACKGILRDLFGEVVLFEPATPSFGGAVRRLWQHTSSDIVLHLEDDWLALQRIDRAAIEDLLVGPVKCVSLMCQEKKWDGRSLLQRTTKKRRLLGKTVWRSTHNQFTTSPSFLDGAFVRACAELLKPDLDPEKQFSNGTNPALERYVEGYQNRFLIGQSGPNVIADIGREWRDRQGIKKNLIAGASVWTSDDA